MTTNSHASVVPAPSSGGVTNDIRGIKSPVAIPNPWAWVGWALALALVAALARWAWRWRKKHPRPVALERTIPADERALAALEAALALVNQPKPFCEAVSAAIRLYLEERFELRAPERTTEEFLAELQTSAALTADHKEILGEFLSHCDLVKFARHEPGESELRRLHGVAARLIVETRPVAVIESQPGRS